MLFRSSLERIPARAVAAKVDPTGAGDAFSAAYVVARAEGLDPGPAAARAAGAAADLLAERAG